MEKKCLEVQEKVPVTILLPFPTAFIIFLRTINQFWNIKKIINLIYSIDHFLNLLLTTNI